MTWVKHGPAVEGRPNILASHSLNPEALDAHVRLYRVVMFSPSGLSRSEREAMAVAVSVVNDCHY